MMLMTLNYKQWLHFGKNPPCDTLIDLFEQQVKNNRDKVALVYKNEQLSFRQLNERANQLAHYLRRKGVRQETLVPICVERSMEMMVGILGILKAGGAYVPIDPEFPADRIRFILEDTRAGLAVTNVSNKEKILSLAPEREIISADGDMQISQMPLKNLNKIEPGQLAYVIYTSGSTGTPKGVMVEHKSIFNYLQISRENFIKEGQNTSGTFIHIPYTFDASLKSIFTPLVSGKLSVISAEPSPLVFEDSNLHKYAPYDFIQLTPSHLDFFYAEFSDRYNKAITRKVSIGGEALYVSHFDYLLDRGEWLQVANEYGPTETIVACTGYYFKVGEEKNIPHALPIGKPVKNVQVYILDEDGKAVQIGEEGEICVGGAQVARGYLNQPELTKRKFVADPFSQAAGAKMYKTGDMGRWLSDGNIEYVGRIDKQVKIRGHRVELGEIESILMQCDLIKNAVVETTENKQGDKQLAAYVVPQKVFDKQAILTFLKDKLPAYLIPEKMIEMDYLPLTPNGKIDRASLPKA
jgi:amino acid adenylation domain-containing protein